MRRASKSSKEFETYDFCAFPGAENADFRPKPQTTRKIVDLTVGLTPIDPRGCDGGKALGGFGI